MTNLINYFRTLFLAAYIAEANFIRFIDDHLHRMTNNNPGGRYTPLITALTAVLTPLKAAIDERNLNQSLQESGTMSVDQLIAEFRALVSRKEGVIADIWDKNNPVYQEFFPRGLAEYHQAVKGNILSLMTRLIAAINNHRNELPADFGVPFNTLKTNFESSRSSQLDRIADTDGNRVNVVQKREAVAKQATKNVLTLAGDFLDQPEMVNVYFDQSIILRPERQNGVEPEPDVFTDAVAAKASATIMHGGFDANTSFHIVNTGSVRLQFYTANMPEDPVPGNVLELAAGEEDDALASALGADSNMFLMAYNPDAAIAGSYEVIINEE